MRYSSAKWSVDGGKDRVETRGNPPERLEMRKKGDSSIAFVQRSVSVNDDIQVGQELSAKEGDLVRQCVRNKRDCCSNNLNELASTQNVVVDINDPEVDGEKLRSENDMAVTAELDSNVLEINAEKLCSADDVVTRDDEH